MGLGCASPCKCIFVGVLSGTTHASATSFATWTPNEYAAATCLCRPDGAAHHAAPSAGALPTTILPTISKLSVRPGSRMVIPRPHVCDQRYCSFDPLASQLRPLLSKSQNTERSLPRLCGTVLYSYVSHHADHTAKYLSRSRAICEFQAYESSSLLLSVRLMCNDYHSIGCIYTHTTYSSAWQGHGRRLRRGVHSRAQRLRLHDDFDTFGYDLILLVLLSRQSRTT